MVSKTILACTAAYSANILPECFILINLDQSVTKTMQYKCRQIATKLANFFYLGCGKSTYEKSKKGQNLNFVYTLHHIVGSQTTLPVLSHCLYYIEASVCVTVWVCTPMCTTLGHSIWASHHGSNALYIHHSNTVFFFFFWFFVCFFFCRIKSMHGDSQWLLTRLFLLRMSVNTCD